MDTVDISSDSEVMIYSYIYLNIFYCHFHFCPLVGKVLTKFLGECEELRTVEVTIPGRLWWPQSKEVQIQPCQVFVKVTL